MGRAEILVTGASGFIGSSLISQLKKCGRITRGTVRKISAIAKLEQDTFIEVGNLGHGGSWGEAFEGIRCVVHLAARAHVVHETATDPLNEFRKVNVNATRELARKAALNNVKRFVFVSSIGVNGNESGQPFKETDEPKPMDLYAVSKLEAEQALTDISEETGIEVVIIRPPLVYGPGAPGNFGSLLKWVAKGVPLPLGAVHNKRSLVALDNLVDFIITCIDHPAAANQTFMVADGENLSTTELLRRVGQAMGKPVRLIPVPMGLLRAGARLLGKQEMARRLCGSLQVDITKARTMLGWNPPVSVDEGLRRAVAGV